ncbi:Zinc finger MYM-type protein 1 [Oopsacas minuta]|uniref:Zinc finger MYM-type protein 1 n=1 Tax=Oopsacas minuta TaxID=111878 RepID=A0AAV7KQF4_9METZ|nr:Zinc finger MYM-type protein 1 [Oopsacas minuta]
MWHQGLALRGHRDEDNTANLNCLFKLIEKFNTSVQNYITADNKLKYLTPQSQNEILKIFAHDLQRHLITRIKSESVGRTRAEEQPIYSIILDETSDINRKEQVSFCIRFCNAHMESEEVFLGFHTTIRTNADTLLVEHF